MKAIVNTAKAISKGGIFVYICLLAVEFAVIEYHGRKYFTGDCGNSSASITDINNNESFNKGREWEWSMFRMYFITTFVKLCLVVLLLNITSNEVNLKIDRCVWLSIAFLGYFAVGAFFKYQVWTGTQNQGRLFSFISFISVGGKIFEITTSEEKADQEPFLGSCLQNIIDFGAVELIEFVSAAFFIWVLILQIWKNKQNANLQESKTTLIKA